MYQALYRKWRPRTFDDVVGQNHITDTLKRQVQTGRLSHAYLFTGTRGTGKTTCAKLLARAVNCEAPENGNPCNKCPACLGIENGSVLDVMELDAASNNRVDDIRAILDEAVYTPATVKKRVYIVDEVHMLSTQAFNALLQILEEPPAHLMFILATTEIHKVPATIKSRCQQFAFRRIHTDQIAARLLYVAGQEGLELTGEGAELIARLADGGMRDALSLLDQCSGSEGTIDQQRVFDALGLAGGLETAALLERAADGDLAGALEQLDRLYAGGKEMSALIGELSALVRDLLVRKTAPAAGSALMTGGFDDVTLRRLSGRFDVPRLVQMLTMLQKTGADLARSANRRTDAELCLAALCDPSLDGSAAALSARVARLEQGAVMAAPQAAAAGRPDPEPAGGGQSAPQPAAAPAGNTAPPPGAAPAPAQSAADAGPKEAPPQSAAAAEAACGRWPGWDAFKTELRSVLPVSDFSFVSMCTGSFDGRTVTLWATNDFIRGMLDKPDILGPVARLGERILGIPVRAAAAAGSAPPEKRPPAPVPPPQPGEEDALEAFIAGGHGNVIVE